ncbi:MAG: flagellar assembly protein FliH [Pigmentiphaga sp.]
MSEGRLNATARLVPRDQLRHWRRWQAGEFATEAMPSQTAAESDRAPADAAEALASVEAERAAAFEAELAALREAARAEGRAQGHAEGLAAGLEEGRATGRRQGLAEGHGAGLAQGQQEAHAQAQALAALLEHCHDTVTQLEKTVPDSLVRLALSVAAQIIGRELRERPEAITALVQDLLHQEPASDGLVKLYLHPDDATLVAAQLGPALADHAWRIVPDDTLERGGCRLITPLGELDATLHTRWQRACAASGQESPWTPD